MKEIIDAEFEVIEPRPPFDWRWIPYVVRMGLALLAIGGVVLASLPTSHQSDQTPASGQNGRPSVSPSEQAHASAH